MQDTFKMIFVTGVFLTSDMIAIKSQVMHLECVCSHYQVLIDLPSIVRLQSAKRLIGTPRWNCIPPTLNLPAAPNWHSEQALKPILHGDGWNKSLFLPCQWGDCTPELVWGIHVQKVQSPLAVSIAQFLLIWSSASNWSNEHMLTVTRLTNLPLIVLKGLRAFRRCLKEHPLYLIPSYCGVMPSRSFWMVLEMVRNVPGPLRSETKITAELHVWMEELERLKDKMQAMGMSISVSDRALL